MVLELVGFCGYGLGRGVKWLGGFCGVGNGIYEKEVWKALGLGIVFGLIGLGIIYFVKMELKDFMEG